MPIATASTSSIPTSGCDRPFVLHWVNSRSSPGKGGLRQWTEQCRLLWRLGWCCVCCSSEVLRFSGLAFRWLGFGFVASFQLFPEVLEELGYAAIICKLLPFELGRVVVYGRLAMLERMYLLVNLFDTVREDRRTKEGINEPTL